ncbi:MAG: NAD(+) synthase, partial [Muribaculaceae bacterium]|nr:NAD(+) synthase [Muribaculaceae bacterium]
LYNCAIAIRGRVLAVIPKTYIPNYNEFYEKRWWASAPDANLKWTAPDGSVVPFGVHTLLSLNNVKIGVEICEDLWTPVPPSCNAAMAGATVIANLSASDDLIGKYNYLRDLVVQQAGRCKCGYVYASAGYGESSTDLVFDGKAFIADNGNMIASNPRWQRHPQYSIADIDIEALIRSRMVTNSYSDCRERTGVSGYEIVDCGVREGVDDGKLLRRVNPLPFVPASDSRLRERCEEIINIQVAGLCRRLEFTHCRNLVIGISGGLDSTLALLVAVRAFDSLGYDRKGICGVTMPGFGTTDRTHDNAVALMNALGVSTREISIVPAVNQHFEDIGHDVSVHDVTYENSQARERTQILMDIANQLGGMVLGTGDLSELALGWATYNGDHMSMYGVNAGVPKTLVRHLTKYFAEEVVDGECRKTLLDIVDTPISPELIPAETDGTIKQRTEDLVGPYELHDFFLYYTLRFGFTPKRIFRLAMNAFDGRYERDIIKHWMTVFFRR